MEICSSPVSAAESRGSALEWQKLLCREYYNFRMTPGDQAGPFHAQLLRSADDLIEALYMQQPIHELNRKIEDIERDKFDKILLIYIISGSVFCNQGDRKSMIATNDCFIMDCGKPFNICVTEATQSLTLVVPREFFVRILSNDDFGSLRIDGSTRWGRALSAYLNAVHGDLDAGSFIPPRSIAEYGLYLVESALRGETASGTTHQKKLLRRIRSKIREQHHKESLAPREVASELGISKAYLYKLLAGEGTTFRRELDAVRIEFAANLLASTAQKRLTIQEIAINCGMPNHHFFSRKFRVIKGMTPSQYRRVVQSRSN